MAGKSPSERLLQQLEEAGVPKGAIAKRLVVQPSAVSDLYAGRRQLKYDEAVKLLGMVPLDDAAFVLPVIGLAGAGNWLEAIEHTRQYMTVPHALTTKGKFLVDVVGNSMNLVLPEGSMAVVDPDDKDLYVGKLYLLINADGEGTIKRYRADPGRFEPVSDDPDFEPIKIGSADFRIVGRITAGMQKF